MLELLPYVGIDLTAGKRPSDVAALDVGGTRVQFAQVLTDDEILHTVHEVGGAVIAIDSPMGLPAGLCCLEESCACTPLLPGTGRSAERALARLGIGCFWTTKRTIIKTMIYRAIGLKARLEQEGCTVLEVYPYATKRLLLGRDLPRKDSAEGQRRLVDGASSLLPGCAWPVDWALNHDQLDALYCAITARLHGLGRTVEIGDASEVPIVVPGTDGPISLAVAPCSPR